ncbi:hypothetical protein DFH06DRAFT_1246171 [Mycena polygramma]|nr:hypothetical protein DFH06DRAFT_1246171 [Mycena polygramma]
MYVSTRRRLRSARSKALLPGMLVLSFYPFSKFLSLTTPNDTYIPQPQDASARILWILARKLQSASVFVVLNGLCNLSVRLSILAIGSVLHALSLISSRSLGMLAPNCYLVMSLSIFLVSPASYLTPSAPPVCFQVVVFLARHSVAVLNRFSSQHFHGFCLSLCLSSTCGSFLDATFPR